MSEILGTGPSYRWRSGPLEDWLTRLAAVALDSADIPGDAGILMANVDELLTQTNWLRREVICRLLGSYALLVKHIAENGTIKPNGEKVDPTSLVHWLLTTRLP